MMSNIIRNRPCLNRLIIILFLGAGLAGCSTVRLPAPTAKAETVLALRSANLTQAMVGEFRLADGKDPNMDKSVGGLRGSTLTAANGSFSQQLKDEVVAALSAAGLYDENSPVRIGGQLTDSMVDAAITTGSGRLAARFTVDRDGKRSYDKELAVESTWPSSFAGPIALPRAINEYGALYKKLTDKLFADKDFQKALQP
jgi:hypothetical protein